MLMNCRGGIGDAAGVILLTGCLVMSACADSSAAREGYSPDPVVARPSDYEAAPQTGLVVDFDVRGDDLYLLESDRVQVLRRSADGWRVTRVVGRSGGGPGEFGQVTGISATRDGFAVTETGRVQFFSRDGEFLVGRPLTPPCLMTRPVLVEAGRGHFLQGSCLRRGYTTDTVKAVLGWAADTAGWVIVTEAVHYTRDGSVGTPFSASTFFSPGEGHHLFGTGYEGCLTRVSDTDSVPAVRDECGLVASYYRAPPPPDVAARMGPRARAAGAVWPEHLPAFVERIGTEGGDVLVRPFSTDSVVLQLAGAEGREMMVMPFEGLVGCKRAVCLWLEEGDPGRMLLLNPISGWEKQSVSSYAPETPS